MLLEDLMYCCAMLLFISSRNNLSTHRLVILHYAIFVLSSATIFDRYTEFHMFGGLRLLYFIRIYWRCCFFCTYCIVNPYDNTDTPLLTTVVRCPKKSGVSQILHKSKFSLWTTACVCIFCIQ